MSFKSTIAAITFAIAALTSAFPQPAPTLTPETPGLPIEPTRLPCNTSTVVNNPICGASFACIPDPDIFCIQPVPKPCLDGMCVPYIKDQRCGGFTAEPNPCEDEAQTCVENVIEGCADCAGYCVWKDGRDALTKLVPKA